MTYGAIFGIAPVYASYIGPCVEKVFHFMAAVLPGGPIPRWPLGRRSDSFDRRTVITLVTLCASSIRLADIVIDGFFSTVLMTLALHDDDLALYPYVLCIAYIGVLLATGQMVAASSTIVVLRGMGACADLVCPALLVTAVGAQEFRWSLVAVYALPVCSHCIDAPAVRAVP